MYLISFVLFQCLWNGIVYEQLEREGPAIRAVDMFFSGMPRIVGLQYFTNLQVIVCVQRLDFCMTSTLLRAKIKYKPSERKKIVEIIVVIRSMVFGHVT